MTNAFTILNANDATYGPQAEVDTVDFEALARGIEGNGIVSGCEVTVQSGTTVSVAAGTVRFGAATASVGAGNIGPLTADATFPRFVLIVVTSSGGLGSIVGTPDASPTFPSMAGFTDRVPVAAVYVPASASSLTADNIVDKRVIVPLPTTGGGGGGGTVLSGWFNVKDYGALGNDSNNDTSAIQAAVNASTKGSVIYFPPGVYRISAPIIVPPFRTVQGNIWAGNTTETQDNNCELKMISGGSAATWGRKGMITHGYYTGNSTEYGPIQVRDIRINGNNQAVGNGIVVMGWPNVIERCMIDNFAGTTDFAESGTNGSGYGIVLTNVSFSGTPDSKESVNNWFQHLRIGSNNCSLYVQANKTNATITDWVIRDIICLKPPAYTHAKDDIRVDAGGGGFIRHVHTNGTAGSGIHFVGSSCGETRIMECYLDGFGCGNGGGTYGAIEIDNFASFDQGADLTISDCVIRHRAEQDGPGQYASIIIGLNNSASVAITNMASHIRSGATLADNFVFDITGTGVVNISNFNCQTLGAGAFADNRIFRSSPAASTIRTSNCSWNFGTAAPTNGWWPKGTRRQNVNLSSSGQALEWICTVSGAPGSWLTHTA